MLCSVLKSGKTGRWLFFARCSIATNCALAVGKLAVGIYSVSLFLCINALYNLGMALAKLAAVRGHQAGQQPADEGHPHGYGNAEYASYCKVGAILTGTSALYILYCLRLFITGENARYSDIIAIAIAACTFTEIGLAVWGSVTLRHGKEPAMAAIKLTNLASSLISVVLTQTAILSFTNEGDNSLYNGLSGVIFGSCAVMIGVYMLLHMSRIMRGKDIRAIQRRADKIAKKVLGKEHGMEWVQYENHGPSAKQVCVRFSAPASAEAYKALCRDLDRRLGVTLVVVVAPVETKIVRT